MQSHIKAERPRGHEINDKLEFRRGLDRQLGGICTAEDAVDVCRHAPVDFLKPHRQFRLLAGDHYGKRQSIRDER